MLPYRVHCYMTEVEGLIERERLTGDDVIGRADELLDRVDVPKHVHDEVKEELLFAAMHGWYDEGS